MNTPSLTAVGALTLLQLIHIPALALQGSLERVDLLPPAVVCRGYDNRHKHMNLGIEYIGPNQESGLAKQLKREVGDYAVNLRPLQIWQLQCNQANPEREIHNRTSETLRFFMIHQASESMAAIASSMRRLIPQVRDHES